MITAPQNRRFAQVIVNRLWKRWMGRGFVEPVDDWVRAKPSHPELLDYLARELVAGGYDLKHVSRLILKSHAYSRQPDPAPRPEVTAADRLFAGPHRRALTAEQLLDSLHALTGLLPDSEELNLSPLQDRPLTEFANLGTPCRAWELTALSNERDRPALALPRAQALVDLMTAYGWRQSRGTPVAEREAHASPVQTLVLANGIVGARATRLTDDNAFTELALQPLPLTAFIRELFVRTLTRPPTDREMRLIVAELAPVYSGRVVPGAARAP
jgi:hypothetical protein